jgi:SAM-dependent methyltransferase
MRERLLEVIECRDCRSDFTLNVSERAADGEIISGSLECPKCKVTYPILRSIPRFIEGMRTENDLRSVYADSFGHQWTTYNWLREEDEYEFHQITDLADADLAGRVVLDAGCGGGRFTRVVAPKCKEIFGLDFSIAVDKAYELCKHHKHAHFIQCDVNRQPFKKGIFDIVYSHGVLHHTPDTKQSFDNLPALVKPGGTFYIAVFRRAFAPLRVTDTALRLAMNRLPIPALDKICGAMSYLSYLPAAVFWKRFLWFSMQKTHEIRKCCLYDWYGPRFHHEHSVEEVQDWFKAAGFANPKYINAWPYAPPDEKYAIPTFKDNLRLGLLLGVIGKRTS